MLEVLFIFLVRLLTGAVPLSRGFFFEPEVQRVYYANHTSHLDTLVLWALIPREQRRRVHPVAARDYWWASSGRRYLAEKVFHAVPVTRQTESFHEDPLEALDHSLKQGGSLIVFPEGTRSMDGKIHPFKGGLFHLASRHPSVEFVPVYIENLNRVLPKGEMLPVPILCTVRFGAGLRLNEGETKSAFIARAQSALEALAAS